MDENPILPARFFFFFSTSSLPQNFPPSYLPPTSPRPTYHLPPPVLPTTYQPLPHSLHRQSSRNVERERAWSWSRSCWSKCLELGGGARSLELCLESERDPRVIEVSLLLFSFFLLCSEPYSSNFFLLRCNATSLSFFFLFAAQQRGELSSFFFAALRSSAASFLHFFLLRCAAAQRASFVFFICAAM